MKKRINKFLRDKMTIDDVNYWIFQPVNQIKKLGVEKLNDILQNRRKSEYLITS